MENAANEFLLTKEIAKKKQGAALQLDPETGTLVFNKSSIEEGSGTRKPVLAHDLIQSFLPTDNLTPEEVHEIGRQTIRTAV